MKELSNIFELLKTDFCDLLAYKMRGNSIEIITPVSTLSNHFVSIFISKRNDGFIISDGGWISKGLYESVLNPDDREVFSKIESFCRNHYEIKIARHSDGHNYYYKSTNDITLISAFAYDISYYIMSVINGQSIGYVEGKDDSERVIFNHQVNSFFKEKYANVSFQSSLENHENIKSIKFNAIVKKPTTVHLVMYITGSTSNYFIKDICKATVNFELVKKNTRDYFNRVAIVNSRAAGFDSEETKKYLENLNELVDRPYIDFWNQHELIEQYIPSEKAA